MLYANDMPEPTANFFRVSHEVIASESFKRMKSPAKVLYFILCALRNRYQRNKDYFTRTEKQLCTDTGYSKRTIQNARKELMDNRLIYALSHKGRRTKYKLYEPNEWRKQFEQVDKKITAYNNKVKSLKLYKLNKQKMDT